MKIGVIIIGSLFWEKTQSREEWRKELSLDDKIIVNLPIRYGRQSKKNRFGTYSMVFSNSLMLSDNLGKGLVIPYKKVISSKKEFTIQMLKLSNAEGISENQICKKWGTVCLIINPFIDIKEKLIIEDYWNQLVAETKNNLMNSEHLPILRYFGEETEKKSIDNNYKLNIDLNIQFKNELKDFDALVATSNAVKFRDNVNIYPSAKQIAKAIYDSEYFEYFLSNLHNSIKTFQDKQIAKLLKRKYHISLKERWKKLCEFSKN